MQLSIICRHAEAQDLSFLMHKHPDKLQSFSVPAGKAYVFYPRYEKQICMISLLLDINPIELYKKLKKKGNPALLHYVNDRPYVGSSFTSTALAKVFSSALNGKCDSYPELPQRMMDFEVKLPILKIKGSSKIISRIFAPLGYEISAESLPLDPHFPEWGLSQYYRVNLKNHLRLQTLLQHLYVLLPVFDLEKHYWVGQHESEKLLEKGKGWLEKHPEKELISKRYLKNIYSLTQSTLEVLNEWENPGENEAEIDPQIKERKIGLHQQRLASVLTELKKHRVASVLDLGCGEGKLLKLLLREGQFKKMLGMDVSYATLLKAKDNLYLDTMAPRQRERIELIQGSLTYRDRRLKGYEAAVLVEVIEHLEPDRLPTLEKILFDFLNPSLVLITTPNAEYNPHYEFLSPDSFRHEDHRFEWSRQEAWKWAEQISRDYSYDFSIEGIGEKKENAGCPSQMIIFQKK